MSPLVVHDFIKIYFKEFLRRKLTQYLKSNNNWTKKFLKSSDVGHSIRRSDGPGNFSPSLSAPSLVLSKRFMKFLESKKKKLTEGTKHHLSVL